MKERNFEKVKEVAEGVFGLLMFVILFVIAPGLPDLLIP